MTYPGYKCKLTIEFTLVTYIGGYMNKLAQRISDSELEVMRQNYDDIINDEFKEKITNSYTKYLFSNYMGIMLRDGEIWFENLNDNGLRIYAINNE